MLTTFINTITKGDVAGLQHKLLHSTCWSQHLHKAYGAGQIKNRLICLFQQFGKCTIEESFELKSDNEHIICLSIKPEKAQSSVHYILWLETNGQVIKSIDAMLDTMKLDCINKHSKKTILNTLPTPDAFILHDYDQQNHLQCELVTPTNIANISDKLASLLDAWWSIWSAAQLSKIDSIYEKQANIILSGHEDAIKPSALFEFIMNKYAHLSRIFCQIEKVIVDKGKVAVKWYLDGDENGKRIRVPYVSILSFKEGKINQDITIADLCAHKKRYPESDLYRHC
ncbi:hypothetical protein CWC18_09865 [Pseudoalteromonas aurantia]|uniref:nuclear transport factor 2 family protein n=1 Tax=Pseudoalteromonas aurantia TaxID=43654 RepID=UPI00110B20FA|nr:nuclear transport factor 2 family protein [Pseudoalteromonas aurantia]TMO62520.1 hypothetical protein CWC18_09865 [Pseudoalteromonas aurantia]